MMASNLLSRIFPPTAGTQSVYETLEREDSSDDTDIEERAGLTIDEENLARNEFQLDPALADAMESQLQSRHSSRDEYKAAQKRAVGTKKETSRKRSLGARDIEDADDDVPMSLLIETNQRGAPPSPHVSYPDQEETSPFPAPVPVLGRATGATRAKWQATQEQQQLHRDIQTGPPPSAPYQRGNPFLMVDPKEKALWRWANVQNLDNFLKDVYEYFLGNGIYSICLGRFLNLLTLAFVVGFSLFLTSCIDYSKLSSSTKMSQILVPKCTRQLSGFLNVGLWVFAFCWIAKLFEHMIDIQRLKRMHDFYHYLLEIPDSDIQTISWQDVVKRLMALRDANPTTAAGVTERHRRFIGSQSKQRMDAHDIANRLMRRENYLIALFNKDILDLTLPVPILRDRPFFSKSLQWNLSFCIMDFVFDEQGQIKPGFLKTSKRRELSDSLRRRFLVAGMINVVCAPFIIIYLLMFYFFRYLNEYQRNPSQIGSRGYTPFAEWKFREFNELWHLFQRRINMSYPFASRYVDQFPKDKTVQVARFCALLAGAVAGVLGLASVIDPEIFLGFEITPDRTVLFYIGVTTTIWAVMRGTVPEENLVFDPEYALNNVVDYTHYLPNQWRGKLHSNEVKSEFTQLYQMKVIIFLEEVLSILTTPFVLFFSLPRCSDQLVDFFREFTVHVDGLGYVCSFAIFDFKKGGNQMVQPPRPTGANEGQGLRDEYYSTRDNKMLASYYNFMDNYATNPKAGVPYLHPSRKNQSQQPPPQLGMMSAQHTGDAPAAGPGRSQQWDRQQPMSSRHGLGGAGSIMPRTPRFAPTGNHASPMASILLDPQHQPSLSSHKQGHRYGARSRLRASKKPTTEVIEDDEDVQPEQGSGKNPIDMSDSHLDDSWKTTRAGIIDDDDDDDADKGTPDGNSDKNTGVLGMVYQFSKAQAEGRGTGVQI